MTYYTLRPGTYYIGDPGRLFKKNQKATPILESIYDEFYKEPDKFQKIQVGMLTFYLTSTLGDGIYNGVGTDTGLIVITNIDDLTDTDTFNTNLPEVGCKYIQVLEGLDVMVHNYNIYFSNGYEIIINK
ncbi:MAG: hypothetical protein PHU13_01540 [Acholeplasmataceae bacterium]|jgi:hypothetical protein|nr:hypothetical protein [Acholeplasmataceae bacterium]MDD4823938.1 hypothetical protein [Acholeplasmataceae bacterium]MDY0316831.1 hypothetical protein [Acholeplasmatales bacterium]